MLSSITLVPCAGYVEFDLGIVKQWVSLGIGDIVLERPWVSGSQMLRCDIRREREEKGYGCLTV